MGIYFGNLDRQLADRQQVLKEDAERQYRGMRDIREGFGGLGSAVTDVVKSEGQLAKLRYDLERQSDYDRMKEQEFKDVSLQRDLKNISGYIKIRQDQHTKLQWPKGSPETVRKLYQERFDQHTKDTTSELYQKILAYPSLYGGKATEDARSYLEILNDPEAEDGALDEARILLEGHAPLTFLKWAVNEKYFNDTIKGDPSAHGNKMYINALINAGYPISDAQELTDSYMGSSASGQQVSLSEGDQLLQEYVGGQDGGDDYDATIDGTLGGSTTSGSGNNATTTTSNNNSQQTVVEGTSLEEALSNSTAGVYITPSGDRFDLGGTGRVAKKKDYKGDEQRYPGLKPKETTMDADGNYTALSDSDAAYIEDRKNTSKWMNYLHPVVDTSPTSPRNEYQIAADNNNAFTLDLLNTKAINEKVIRERDKVKRPPDWVGYKKEGPESTKDDKFFPFMEGVGDEDIEKYRNLPNYATWENVPEAEKLKLQTDTLVKLGANIKEVAEYRKKEQVLQDKDDEILLLHNEIASRIKANPSLNALHGGGITNLITASEAPRKLEKIKSPYGGKIGTPVEINQLIENYNKRIHVLKDDADSLRSSLSTSVPKIKAKKSGRDLRGKASDYGISNTRNPNIAPSWWQNIGTTPVVDIDARELQDIYNEARQTIMDKEGLGIRGEGHAYYDGKTPSKDGSYGKGSENLILAGGNNVYDLIQSIPNEKDREIELQEVAKMLFGEGSGEQSTYGSDRNNKDEFLRYMRMDKDKHKYQYATHEQRGGLSLRANQVETLTGYMMDKNLELLQKKHPYLNDIARYPKEMQLFIMDNAFNMGPGWLEKFDKLEAHLKSWNDSRSDAHLKLIMREYKDSDHYRSKITGDRALNNYKRLQSLLV